MARRRGRGEGSIRQRKDGRWEVRIDLGRDEEGQRQRKTVYAATQADAIRQQKRLAGRALDGQLIVTTTPTVSAFLDQWFSTNEDSWRPSTRRSYRGAIEQHLKPAFGTPRKADPSGRAAMAD